MIVKPPAVAKLIFLFIDVCLFFLAAPLCTYHLENDILGMNTSTLVLAVILGGLGLYLYDTIKIYSQTIEITPLQFTYGTAFSRRELMITHYKDYKSTKTLISVFGFSFVFKDQEINCYLSKKEAERIHSFISGKTR